MEHNLGKINSKNFRKNKVVTLTGVCARASAMDFSTVAPEDQRLVDTLAVAVTGAKDFPAEAPEDAADTPAVATLGRRTRQQTRDEMYEHLEELSRRNCRINQENTSHEHHRIAKALRRE